MKRSVRDYGKILIFTSLLPDDIFSDGVFMDLRVLRYFLAVVKEENVSKAAEFLHVTQPTLSRQLMELEDELGVKLFARGSRKITLTEAGMLLRKRAEEIVELAGKTKAELLSPDDTVSGDIYIGAGETDAMGLIAKVAGDLQKDCPGIRFHIYSGDVYDVTERLDKGLLDFGVLVELAGAKKYDSIRLPVKDVWGVYMRKDSPLASLKTIKPEDLWNEPLIISRQSLESEQISDWFKKDFDKLNIAATYNLVYNATLMVKEGMGYALSLEKLVNTEGESGLCFRPLEPPLEAGLAVIWKKYPVFSKAADMFIRKIRLAFEGSGQI